jgi:hypothetical protein
VRFEKAAMSLGEFRNLMVEAMHDGERRSRRAALVSVRV